MQTFWNEVREEIGKRFRAAYAIPDDNYRQYAVAAMLATGASDFRDIIRPLLSGQDRQTRLATYRIWPDIKPSSLGPYWREQVRAWSEEARKDFISELLHHRADSEIVSFAVEDSSVEVKKAAVVGLMWIGSDDALARVLKSMDTQTFEDVARENLDRLPPAFKPRAVAAMRIFVENATDQFQRLRTALNMIELNEPGMDGVVKDALSALPTGDMRNLNSHYILPALEYLYNVDPTWTSEWVVGRIADGGAYGYEEWLPFATVIPSQLVEKYLHLLETENLEYSRVEGMIAVVAASADAELAARVFSKLRELRRRVDAESSQRHELEWQALRQLEAVFRRYPDDVAATGVLSSVVAADPPRHQSSGETSWQGWQARLRTA